MRRVSAWSGSLRGFEYKPIPPNLTGIVTMATILWGPKGELGRGGGKPESGHKQILNAPGTCAHRDNAQSLDVMEMTDKALWR